MPEYVLLMVNMIENVGDIAEKNRLMNMEDFWKRLGQYIA